MSLKKRFPQWLQSDWFQAFLLFLIFLAIKGYKYGWDDQHLEIPLLKSLIDNTLYPGDYYVQSLKSNFCSYFFPLLARFITVEQIPAAYLSLYLLAKYFLFFWIYKLWFRISKQKSVAFICTIIFMTFGRTPEFHYRTFSHQEFALAFVFAGIYFFYTERFLLASIVLGIAANFHFLYSLLPMAYLGFYLILNFKQHGWRALLKSTAGFALCALPILIWMVKKNIPLYMAKPVDSPVDWVTLYKTACLQNFVFFGFTVKQMLRSFNLWISMAHDYILITALYAFNLIHSESFQKDKKAHAIFFAAVLLLIFSYVFTYYIPTRFVLDLNLVRNVQYLFLILTGYSAILILEMLNHEGLILNFCMTILFSFLILNDFVAILSVGLMIFLPFLLRPKKIEKSKNIFRSIFGLSLTTLVTIISWNLIKAELKAKIAIVTIILIATFFLFLFRYLKSPRLIAPRFRRLPIIILLIVMCSYQVFYHVSRDKIEQSGSGFWKLQRDWEDMERYAQKNTPKDAVILAPNDMEMGGFRIYSERTVVCCYRDCGIVGFDYRSGVEWLKRLSDIKAFKVIREGDIYPAVLKGIFKYKASYIVFMRYYAPTDNPQLYRKIHENDSFSLYKVTFNNPS